MAPHIHELVGRQFGEFAAFGIAELAHEIGASLQIDALVAETIAAAAAAHFAKFTLLLYAAAIILIKKLEFVLVNYINSCC